MFFARDAALIPFGLGAPDGRRQSLSVFEHGLELLGFLDVALDFLEGGNVLRHRIRGIEFLELREQVFGNTVCKFTDRVDARGFEGFSILRTDPMNADQVGMVRPTKNELFVNAEVVREEATLRRRAHSVEQVMRILDALHVERVRDLLGQAGNEFDFIKSSRENPRF